LKRIVLWTTALLLIAGSWGGNVWYYNSMQLAEPLFLPHYIATRAAGGELIELTYLENKADQGEVTGIQIEELPMLRFELREHSRYSNHVLMKAYASWEPGMPGAPDEGQLPLTIREVTVHYGGGASKRVSIGEIQVMAFTREGVLETVSASGSSDGTGSYAARVTQKIVLEKVGYSYSDRLATGFRLALGGQPIEELSVPLELDEGDMLSFTYEWLPQEDERVALEEYNIKLLLHFRTTDGRAVLDTLPVNRNVYLSEAQVKRLVRTGGDQT
jgi:hypothetical protein